MQMRCILIPTRRQSRWIRDRTLALHSNPTPSRPSSPFLLPIRLSAYACGWHSWWASCPRGGDDPPHAPPPPGSPPGPRARLRPLTDSMFRLLRPSASSTADADNHEQLGSPTVGRPLIHSS